MSASFSPLVCVCVCVCLYIGCPVGGGEAVVASKKSGTAQEGLKLLIYYDVFSRERSEYMADN